MKVFELTRCASCAVVLLGLVMAPLLGWAQDIDGVPEGGQADESSNTESDGQRIGVQEDWTVAIGLASFSVPLYSGDDDTESLVVPNLEVRYRDKLNLSFLTGINYDLLNRPGWRAGPFLDWDFGRDINSELVGFDEIRGGLELGGFVDYIRGDFTARIKVLQGVDGHGGTSITATFRHAKLYDTGLIPLFFLIGPALRFGNSEYLNTFYGVSEEQSLSSGLPQTSLSQGIISYGLDAVLVVPLSRKVFIRNFFLVEVLTGDVDDSPIVTNAGDEFQRTLGIEFGYLF